MASANPQIYDELFSGRYYGVFVDDTGSPGLEKTPKNLHPSRSTWAGVVIPPDKMQEVLIGLPEVTGALEEVTGAKELHWVDIFGGTGDFVGIHPDFRLMLFSCMAELFAEYKLPVFVETWDPESVREFLQDNQIQLSKKGPLD